MSKFKSERLNRLQALKGSTKKPTNLSFDPVVFKDFKKVIGKELSASEVLEDYMRDEIAVSRGELEIIRHELKPKK